VARRQRLRRSFYTNEFLAGTPADLIMVFVPFKAIATAIFAGINRYECTLTPNPARTLTIILWNGKM